MRTGAGTSVGRIAAAVERAAELVRLLAWTAMAGGYCLMLWALSESAHADGRADAPRQPAAFAGQATSETTEQHRCAGPRP